MSTEPDRSDRDALAGVVDRLEAAWNALDGDAFAAPFADDADFVNIRGQHFRGRAAIAAGHTGIFRTIYAGSRNRYAIDGTRLLRPDVALVHVRAELDVPQGPLAGRHLACFSMVLTKDAGTWTIAAFHNTLQAPPTS
jgi:uncharacterized protein (TIGR02246 family)